MHFGEAHSDVECGERNIALANILKIATALEIPASQIRVRAEHLLREHG